jgi:predicted GH43/DUF377 family glycosyl hydrolase
MTNEEAVNVLRIMASGIELKGYSDHWVSTFREAYEMAFKALEEKHQDEWVLITERLPDYMEHILVTFQKPNREPLVYRAVFIGGKFVLDNGDTWNWNDLEIKAWMPLPEAYKEADND